MEKLRDDWVAKQSRRPDVQKFNFSNEKLHEQAVEMLGGQIITSPYHIAIVEQLRQEVLAEIKAPEKVPTDVFIFSKGEPVNRAVTKIGGLPYWPAKRSWPSRRVSMFRKKTITFIAQFCFVDSKDIVGNLPGDLLLIFGDEEKGQYGEAEDLDCQWVSLDEGPIVTEREIPETKWKIPPCYGSIYRTFDLLDASDQFERYRQSYLIDIIEGTKIGGKPRWIQSDVETPVPTRFLCALGSIMAADSYPRGQIPFPYLNVPEPLTHDEENNLMWGDAGSVYFLINDEGGIHCNMQCY